MRTFNLIFTALVMLVSMGGCTYIQDVEYEISDIDKVYNLDQSESESDNTNKEVIIITTKGTKITTSKYIFDKVSNSNNTTIISSRNIDSDVIDWYDVLTKWTVFILYNLLLFIVIAIIMD